MTKLLSALLAVGLSCLTIACGGGSGNPAGVPMPSIDSPTGTVPNATPTTVDGDPSILRVTPPSFSLPLPGNLNRLTILDIPSPGTAEITITWSSTDSTIGVALLSQPGCVQTSSTGWSWSWDDIAAGKCATMIGPAERLKDVTKTFVLTRPVPAGQVYLFISNQRDPAKGGGESGEVKVILTHK
jgi:hypothetical protein